MKKTRFLFLCLSLLIASLPSAAALPTHKILAVRVDFPFEDPDHDTTSGRGVFDLRNYYDERETAVRREYSHPWDIPPHNRRYFENHLLALKNYWYTVSEERVNLTYDVYPKASDAAYTLSNTFYKYGNGRTKEQTNRKLVNLLQEALNACKDAEGDRIDFSVYDTFMVIHAGIGSETSGALNDIPSAYINDADIATYLDSPLVIDGKTIDNGIIVPEMAACNGYGGLNGIMAQMFGHRLGLPSMSNNKDGLPAAGGWALMDTGSMSFGAMSRGFVPTHPCIWSKIELGWIKPVVITADTTIDIAATHINNGLPRAVKIPINADEYLLIENRIRYAPRDSLPNVVFSDSDSSGVWLSVNHYDAFIPGSGILVWHINDAIIRKKRAAGEINNDINRRGIDLLEADGREDIGALMGFGDPRGDYAEGHDDDTYKSNGVSYLGPSTKPNTGSMWGGTSGIEIHVNTNPSDIMNVTIKMSAVLEGFPFNAGTGGHLTAFDVDGDEIDELVVSNSTSYTILSAKGKKLLPFDMLFPHPAVTYAFGSLPNLVSGHHNGIEYLFKNNGTYETQPTIIDIFDNYQVSFRANPVTFISGDGIETLAYFMPSMYDKGDMKNAALYLQTKYGTVRTVSFPDTIHVDGLTAAFPYFAAAGERKLCIGNLNDDTATIFTLDSRLLYGPIMADFDRDNNYETVVAVNNGLSVFSLNGDSRFIQLSDTPSGEPALADIDSDGYPEIIVCSGKFIYAFRRNGIPATGFPFKLPPGNQEEMIVSPPIIGDLDNDGDIDIAFATSTMRIVSLDVHGAPTQGFPIALIGHVIDSPCLFRHDVKGTLAIAYQTTDGRVAAHDLGVVVDPKLLPWTMWKGNPRLTASLSNTGIISGIKTKASFEAYCYPNPVTGDTATFRITPSEPTDLTIVLYTADGRKIYDRTVPQSSITPGVPNEIVMDASELASGLYIAKIVSKQKSVMYKLGVLK